MAPDTVMPNLHLECPYCDHSHGDPLEVLDHTPEDAMRCEQCGRTFAFSNIECPQCETDNIRTWAEGSPRPEDMRCCECHHALEASEEE